MVHAKGRGRFASARRHRWETAPADEPPVDVIASATTVWVRLAAPGVTPQDLRIEVHGRSISVAGRRRALRPPSGAEFIQAEILLGGFQRRIDLPWEADPQALRVRAINGIVELLLARCGQAWAAARREEEES